VPVVGGRISRFPYKELPHMPVSLTTLGRPDARACAPDVLPSAMGNASASQMYVVFGAQWLAYALPCRRFTPALTDDGARLGADVVRSGRIEARTGLRMMPTFPRSPLSFRTAGFPRYGWKAGFSDGAFPASTRA
jgi:hypothetical protein